MTSNAIGPFAASHIDAFIRDGFVRLDNVFPADVAAAGRALLWPELGCKPDDPSSWTRPVIRVGYRVDEPFRAMGNAPVLRAAFDQLAGPGRWLPLGGLGTFPIRFPSPDDPGDAGWHIDVGMITDPADFMGWRANITSSGRTLLVLVLLSDVGPTDAPTRLRLGSHRIIAQRLAPFGTNGLSLRDLVADGFDRTEGCAEVLATGLAGTVYLCHPFLVHAAQSHHGVQPRFLAQPALLPAEPLQLDRTDGDYSPVEQAIRCAVA